MTPQDHEAMMQAEDLPSANTYQRLLDQREVREDGSSTGIDAEYIAAHYLVSSAAFKWAAKWDDLNFPGDYRWQKIERGIDVIAEHIDGTIWAIQVKDYQKFVDYKAFTNMNAFVQSGERHGVKIDRMAIVCADKPAGRVLIEVCEENDTVIYDHTDLAKLVWPKTFVALRKMYRANLKTIDPKFLRQRLSKPRRAPKRLWKHQNACLQAMKAHFRTETKGRVYMPPGSGKTVTFVRFAEDYENVLAAVPSLLLAQQTFEKFVQQSRKPYDHVLFVASESPKYDDLKLSDLTGRHTTDVEEIRAFMSLPGRKLLIPTYKSSGRIAEAQAGIDLAIFDEAHHMAGFQYNGDLPKQAQALLDYKGILCSLFMTATPRVYSSDIKTIAANGDHYVTSLDDESQFGKLVYEFTYQAALKSKDKIVKPYEIHLVAITDEEYREALGKKRIKDSETRKPEMVSHVCAALAYEKIRGKLDVHHTLCFTNTINNADRMTRFSKAFGGTGYAETLSSKRTVDANKRGQYDFEHSPEGFIANVNIFGEGIDAPCVDCVIFADPMQSKDAIAQKVGRGWRYDPANPDAKLIVIVPVLLDKDGIDGTDPKKFKTILEVLGAIGSLDKTLEVEINEVASNLPCDGGDQIFIVEGDIPVVDLVRLRKTITTSVYSGASLSW